MTDFTNSITTLGGSANNLSFDSKGDLLVAGRLPRSNGTVTDMVIWNISKTTGSLITNNGVHSGVLITPNPTNQNSWATIASLDANGNLVVMGGADDALGINHMQLWRYSLQLLSQ